MPTKNTGDMVVRAMRWALAHGHTAEEAYDLATYMTGNELPEKEAEKKEKKEQGSGAYLRNRTGAKIQMNRGGFHLPPPRFDINTGAGRKQGGHDIE